MSAPEQSLIVRYMDIKDIPDVMEIDEASFKPPWPERSYRFEINESHVSYMVILEKIERRDITGWRRLMNNLRGADIEQEEQPVIVGYGGLWKIAEESHVSTIASHPDYRGQKFGEILLACMIRRAIVLKAEYVVLEVRVSNHIAQRLYEKYGFKLHGTKKNYYHHDKEDAYDMRLELDTANIEHVNHLVKALARKVNFQDRFSSTLHPRMGR